MGISDRNTLVIIGDSYCYGTGLGGAIMHVDHIKSPELLLCDDYANWPTHYRDSFVGLVAHHYDMNMINFSIPGCGNATMYRLLMEFIISSERVVPLDDIVVLLCVSGNNRYEVYGNDMGKYFMHSPTWPVLDKPSWRYQLDNIYNKHIFSSRVDDAQSTHSIVSLSHTLEYYNIPWVFDSTVFTFADKTRAVLAELIPSMENDSITNYAIQPHLPCGHPTHEGHAKMAIEMIKRIDDELF